MFAQDGVWSSEATLVTAIAEVHNMPDDLLRVMNKFVEHYSIVNSIHKMITQTMFFKRFKLSDLDYETGGCTLGFSTDGSNTDVSGMVSLNVISKLWKDGQLTIQEEKAITLRRGYSCPLWIVKEGEIVSSQKIIEAQYAPLRKTGWEISTYVESERVYVKGALPYVAMMSDGSEQEIT